VSVGEEVVAEERVVQEGLKNDREEAGLAKVEDSSDACCCCGMWTMRQSSI